MSLAMSSWPKWLSGEVNLLNLNKVNTQEILVNAVESEGQQNWCGDVCSGWDKETKIAVKSFVFKEWLENTNSSNQASSKWQIIWVAICNPILHNCWEKLFKICQCLIKAWFESNSLIQFLTPVLFFAAWTQDHQTFFLTIVLIITQQVNLKHRTFWN